MTPRELWARTLGRLRRNPAEAELDEEIAAHLEMAIEENLASGMSPEEARRAAMRRFGGVMSAREKVYEQSGLPSLDGLVRDVRLALRALRRAPGFTLVAVSTLALGIGICSAFVSILNGVLLKHAPGIADPATLFATQQTVSYAELESLRDARIAPDAAAWIGAAIFNVVPPGGAETERVNGHIVSPEYFRVLGAEPGLGRLFSGSANVPDDRNAVVISHDYWQTKLGADPAIVGRSIRLNGRQATIAGVTQPGFAGVFPQRAAKIFVPATADSEAFPELAVSTPFRALLRIDPQASPKGVAAAAEEHLNRLDAELGERPKLANERRQVTLLPAGTSTSVPPEMKAGALALYAVLIGLVLSLTCASLAGLVMARDGARTKEVAIRLSLGASRGHIVRRLLTESLVLAFAGGAAGLAAAWSMIQAITRYVNNGSANLLSPDFRVATLTFVIAGLAAVGFGLLPALGATRPNLTPALKGYVAAALPKRRRFGLRNLFVVAQVAVSVSLLLVLGMLTLGTTQGGQQDAGFDLKALYVFSVDPRRDGFTAHEGRDLAFRVTESLEALPRIEAVSFAAQAPLSLSPPRQHATVPSDDGAGDTSSGTIQVRAIGPHHLESLGAKILLGRGLAPEAPHEVVLNQGAAEALFGVENPLGRRIRISDDALEVVGVVRYGSSTPLGDEPTSVAFVETPSEGIDGAVTFVIRAPAGVDLAAVESELDGVDPRLTLFDARTLEESLSELERARRSVTALNLGVSGFALVLACVGLAGVTAQAMERRRKEIGIEIALGARWTQVVRGVMREGAVMTGCGLALGWCAAYGLAGTDCGERRLRKNRARRRWRTLGNPGAACLVRRFRAGGLLCSRAARSGCRSTGRVEGRLGDCATHFASRAAPGRARVRLTYAMNPRPSGRGTESYQAAICRSKAARPAPPASPLPGSSSGSSSRRKGSGGTRPSASRSQTAHSPIPTPSRGVGPLSRD